MRTTLKKSLALLIAVTMIVAVPITSFAAYYDPESFTFWKSNRGDQRWYDGGHMAAEITASSDTSGLTMQVTANIVDKGAVTWNVKVDGKMHKKDWISLGTSYGRNVYFTYSCLQNPNAKITVHNKSYSW